MRKITLFLFALFSCLSYGQTCEQYFTEDGYESDGVSLTVGVDELTCAEGTFNSITITGAYLDDDWFSFACGEYYTFELDLDGVVTSVCADDLIDMDITGFTSLTITAFDEDGYEDYIYIDLEITVDYTPFAVPDCINGLTAPQNATNDALAGLLKWNAVSTVGGYTLTVGTTPGGNDVLDQFDAGNVTQYDIPGLLNFNTTYYVSVIPYNSLGDAEDCIEYNFTTPVITPGVNCANPKVINALPYAVTDNTANYFDVYEGAPGTTCGTTNSYLSGNDAVYSYTAVNTGSIKVVLTPTGSIDTYLGFFIYGDCDDIGVACLSGAASAGIAPKSVNEFDVTAGETYYFVVSTWADPQTASYTLQINENTCENGAATFAVNSLCDADSSGFEVTANISSLGSATSVTVSDNQGNSEVVSVEGPVVLGPYANNTSVIVTVLNNQDGNCSIISTPLNQLVCPPSNDNCLGALELVVNEEFECVSFTSGTVAGATASVVNGNTCYGTANDDVWFSFVATDTKHRITIFDVSNEDDMYHSLWKGSCEGLTLVAGSCSDNDISNPSSLEIGQTYYVRVYTYTSIVGQTSTFNICIGTVPPVPVNDSCDMAIDITGFPYTNAQDASSATNNDGFITACEEMSSGMNDGVWYTVVGNGYDITIEATSFEWDGKLDVYTGSCGEFECLGSEDSSLENEAEVYVIEDSALGEVYYINFGYYSDEEDEPEGAMTIKVTSSDLGIDNNELNAFKAYPNPVSDILNLSYSQNITNVEVFNLLGQQIVVKSINALNGEINLSNLASGAYLLKVFIGDKIKTMKIVKK